LTARLLAFSRRRPVTREVIDANDIIAGLADILRYTLGGGIEVETALAPDLCPILADRNQLENAILNLAVNARDAMPDGGRLTIETQNISVDGKNAVAIMVRDTGRGMPPEVLQRALEPFFTTKGEGRGTGLGLAQVQALVRQSDGSVQIDSAPGAGTTVTLRFRALG
jgi:signal transduction histidine kinase